MQNVNLTRGYYPINETLPLKLQLSPFPQEVTQLIIRQITFWSRAALNCLLVCKHWNQCFSQMRNTNEISTVFRNVIYRRPLGETLNLPSFLTKYIPSYKNLLLKFPEFKKLDISWKFLFKTLDIWNKNYYKNYNKNSIQLDSCKLSYDEDLFCYQITPYILFHPEIFKGFERSKLKSEEFVSLLIKYAEYQLLLFYIFSLDDFYHKKDKFVKDIVKSIGHYETLSRALIIDPSLQSKTRDYILRFFDIVRSSKKEDISLDHPFIHSFSLLQDIPLPRKLELLDALPMSYSLKKKSQLMAHLCMMKLFPVGHIDSKDSVKELINNFIINNDVLTTVEIIMESCSGDRRLEQFEIFLECIFQTEDLLSFNFRTLDQIIIQIQSDPQLSKYFIGYVSDKYIDGNKEALLQRICEISNPLIRLYVLNYTLSNGIIKSTEMYQFSDSYMETAKLLTHGFEYDCVFIEAEIRGIEDDEIRNHLILQFQERLWEKNYKKIAIFK